MGRHVGALPVHDPDELQRRLVRGDIVNKVVIWSKIQIYLEFPQRMNPGLQW